MLHNFVPLEVDGVAIVGQLYLPDSKVLCPAVCLCHGIPSGNPPDPGDGGYPQLAERICRDSFAVLIFNFRGTGYSGGNLDILGWTQDLRAGIDHLWSLDGIDKSHLSLVGFSAGAAVSVYVAARDERVSGVVACACPADFSLFDEPQSIIDRFRVIGTIRDEGFPPSVETWFSSFAEVTPVNHVAGIAPRPLLLVHGSQDDLVPLSHGRRLYGAAGEPKELVVLEGAGHRLRQDDRAVGAILDWLKSRGQDTG